MDSIDFILSKAKACGATGTDIVMTQGESVSIAYRLGKLEKLERSEGFDVGIRVFIGQKSAIVSSSDTREAALAQAVEKAVAMAKYVPDDAYSSLAQPEQLATTLPALDAFDATDVSPEQLIEACQQAEDIARSHKGITNSEGAEAGYGKATITLATSNGFCQTYASSHHSLSACVLAGEGTEMERDYDYTTATYYSDLAPAAQIGQKAAEKALKRLNPRKVKTGSYPVIYDKELAGSLLRSFAGAINGQAVARGTTFLKESLGKAIFPKGIRILDDPHRPRGLRSKPFDAEGLATSPIAFVEDGVLTAWVLDLATAKQLNMHSNARATRSVGSAPSPSVTNLTITGGTATLNELLLEAKTGFYVTETMGMGVNLITGDYSQGASGFWIENGNIAYPVSEVTIASTLQEMFATLVLANDGVYKTGIDAPSLLIPKMTIAGE
jgi:PmbA protein